MRLPCTVVIVNRLSFGSMAGIVKPSKGILHLCDCSTSKKEPMILISTAKELQAHKYYVKNIETIRERFIEDGQATFEMKQPQVTLMIRKANVPQLKNFLMLIKQAQGDGGWKLESTNTSSNETEPKSRMKQKPSSASTSSSSFFTSSGSGIPEPNGRKSGSSRSRSAAAVPRSGRSFGFDIPPVYTASSPLQLASSSSSAASTSAAPTALPVSEQSINRGQKRKLPNPTSASSSSTTKKKAEGAVRLVEKTGKISSYFDVVPPRADTQRSSSSSAQHQKQEVKKNPAPPAPPPPPPPKELVNLPYSSTQISKASWTQVSLLESRRLLRTNNQELKVNRREQYPLKTGFHPQLVNLQLNNCQLSRIDSRILELKYLRNLNLSSNCIPSIERLSGLRSMLNILILDNNRIERIPENFFNYPSISPISFLSLKGNQLTTLPNSICTLKKLQILILSENQLKYLPYALNQLTNLLRLHVSENQLTFLPYTITILNLMKLDISGNKFPLPPVGQQQQHAPQKVQLKPFTTLYERAAALILTHNHKNRQYPFKCIDLEGPQLPQTVRKYLESVCKYCIRCESFTARYTLVRKDLTINDLALETVSTHLPVPAKSVLCETCSTSPR